jgi:hypothetical protein
MQKVEYQQGSNQHTVPGYAKRWKEAGLCKPVNKVEVKETKSN